MQKNGRCSCGQTITMPKAQCLVECSKCRKQSLFLCHFIGQVVDPMNIRCRECKKLYSLFTCPQCEATAIINEFRSGHPYMCVCGFKAMMLTCNKCVSLLCLPASKNYQLTLVKCKKCASQFKYTLCSQCKQCIYLRTNYQTKDLNICYNSKCPKCPDFNSQKEPVKQYQNPYGQQSAPNPQNNIQAKQTNNAYPTLQTAKQKQTELCKICLNSESCMINTSCFHLAVCEPCSLSLKGKCPICRKEGTYSKVYKS